MIWKSAPVPTVDPQQLRWVLTKVYDFVSEDDSSDPLAKIDLHELLDHIAATLRIQPEIAVALFKRAVALAAFCASDTLADTYFEDGIPGRTLCAAAARVTVLDAPSAEDGELGHVLDTEEMQRTLRNGSN